MKSTTNSHLFRFPKNLILRKNSDFQHVFKTQLSLVTSGLVFLRTPNTLKHPRLGIIIAKKNVKRAVDRNRIKRLIRERFRLRQATLPAFDIIVIARHGIEQRDKSTLHALLDQQWEKLQHICEKSS